MSFTLRELTPGLWPDLERLFGGRGACGGCWCMAWRVERGGKLWERTKGEPARLALRGLVAQGIARGILAYRGGEPVGWCSLGPRAHFPRLETVKAYRRSDTSGVWSINCFFLAKECRGLGLSKKMLKAAVEACRRGGAQIVEGYPVRLTKAGEKLPPAFSWMGPLPIFEQLGFEIVQEISPSRPLVRLQLKRTTGSRTARVCPTTE